jgi:thioester reductase-like protein
MNENDDRGIPATNGRTVERKRNHHRRYPSLSKYVFLTGATGLVGRYLIRDLLLQGCQLVVLVRSTMHHSPQERLEAILQRWEKELGKLLPRPVCLEGDVCQENLGLDSRQMQWVEAHCDTMLHNAAVLTFYGSDRSADPWRTNVGGTQHVLDFCSRVGLRDLHYVSTAYVCGNREDRVMEDELDPHCGFRNDYEESKYLAEKLIREADFLDQLTIYRPAVIAGDSQTGYTNTYHGLYMYLKLISVLVRNAHPDDNGVRDTPVRLNMTGDEPRNIVPVDWVSKVICHLFNTPAAHGGVYHLAPEQPLTPREIVDAGYKYFNSRGVEFAGKDSEERAPISDIDQALHENKAIYQPYEASDPCFDVSELRRMAGHLPCPVIDVAMLHRFWNYGEEDRWGKRRETQPSTDFWVSEYLSKLECSVPDSARGNGDHVEPVSFGLNVLGPGGGQWRLTVCKSQVSEVVPGLPSHGPILTFRSDILASACSGDPSQNDDLTAMVGEASDGSLNDRKAQQIADSLFGVSS